MKSLFIFLLRFCLDWAWVQWLALHLANVVVCSKARAFFYTYRVAHIVCKPSLLLAAFYARLFTELGQAKTKHFRLNDSMPEQVFNQLRRNVFVLVTCNQCDCIQLHFR